MAPPRHRWWCLGHADHVNARSAEAIVGHATASIRRRTSGSVIATSSGPRPAPWPAFGRLVVCGRPGPHRRQERQRQHRELDVAVLPGPGADLVLVKARLLLGSLEAALDRPAL